MIGRPILARWLEAFLEVIDGGADIAERDLIILEAILAELEPEEGAGE